MAGSECGYTLSGSSRQTGGVTNYYTRTSKCALSLCAVLPEVHVIELGSHGCERAIAE